MTQKLPYNRIQRLKTSSWSPGGGFPAAAAPRTSMRKGKWLHSMWRAWTTVTQSRHPAAATSLTAMGTCYVDYPASSNGTNVQSVLSFSMTVLVYERSRGRGKSLKISLISKAIGDCAAQLLFRALPPSRRMYFSNHS